MRHYIHTHTIKQCLECGRKNENNNDDNNNNIEWQIRVSSKATTNIPGSTPLQSESLSSRLLSVFALKKPLLFFLSQSPRLPWSGISFFFPSPVAQTPSKHLLSSQKYLLTAAATLSCSSLFFAFFFFPAHSSTALTYSLPLSRPNWPPPLASFSGRREHKSIKALSPLKKLHCSEGLQWAINFQ